MSTPAEKKYYQENREKIIARGRARYLKYRETIRANRKRRYYENPAEAREKSRRYRAANQEPIRWRRLKTQFGLSKEQFYELLAKQRNRCAICFTDNPGGRWGRNWIVDHDHFSRKVRGVLCNSCNTGLGIFKDNPLCLARAIAYLQRPPCLS